MKEELQKLYTKLDKIEKELEKCRTTVLKDGWQTQKHAKKLNKWDYYAQEKHKIRQQIEELENKDL